jgi:uncharacterized membrane protein YgcG
MLTRKNTTHRFVTVSSGLLAGLLLTLAAMSASAQGAAGPDVRWQPWLGCWTLGGLQPRVVGATSQSHAVCIVPTSISSAVDIATVEDGKVVDRQRINADDAHHPSTKDGCTGWESAQWSAWQRRVFVRSEYSCSGGVKRSASGVLAITGTGEWIDVQGISSGGNKGVRALRYADVRETGAIPAELADLLGNRAIASGAARVSAAAPLTVADIAEASQRLEAGVVEAWLVEFNSGAEAVPAGLNAKTLVELADAGVPPGVIDVVVALAYPHVFSLNPATREGEFRTAEGGTTSSRTGMMPVVGYDAYGLPIYASDSFLRSDCTAYGYSPYASSYGCSPYCMGYYGVSSLACSRYGYSAYGPGYGYGYGSYGYGYGSGYGYGFGPGYGWYPGSQPIVVVQGPQPTGIAPPPHGRAVNGHGYTQGGSTTTSTPRSSTESGSGSGSGSPSAGSSSGSSGSGGSSGGSSAGRTAVPKKP